MKMNEDEKRQNKRQKLPELPPMAMRRKLRKDAVPDRIYSFEIPPDPISASTIKETATSDVVVGGVDYPG